MTNLAILALAITLAAETSTDDWTEATDSPAETAARPPSPKHAAAARPSAKDTEVQSEVVDLKEAKDPAVGWYGPSFPDPVRVLALPTARALRAGDWEFTIDYRSTSPVYDNSAEHPLANMWNSYFGLDSAIRLGLGIRYGLIADLDIGIYRVGTDKTDTYEFDARYQILRQEEVGLDLAVRYGLTWFAQPNTADAAGYFTQLLVSHILWDRLLVTGGALYHSNSTNDTKYNQDKPWSAALAGGLELRAAASLAFDAEFVSCAAGYCSRRPTLSGGMKYITHRYTFALLGTNTVYETSDGYLTNTDRPWSHLSIGFNITRQY